MALTLDHLVILADDLDQAQAEYTRLGFTITPGGTHVDGLTHNALIIFADGTYLELIAFLDPADRRDNVWGWRQYSSKGGGLIDYCFVSDDLEGEVAKFREHGLTVDEPTTGGRLRPDGVALRWRSARFWQAGRELPFLIEDLTPRELRVPAGGANHPNGVTGIGQLMVAVADLGRIAAIFGILLDTPSPTFGTYRRYDARTASFDLGLTTLTLAAPTNPFSPLQQRFETLGMGPVAVTWATSETTVPAKSSPSRTWFGSR